MQTSLFAPREIDAKRPSPCWSCGQTIEAGARIFWHKSAFRGANGQLHSPVWHAACPTPTSYTKPANGTSDSPSQSSTPATTYRTDDTGAMQPAPSIVHEPDTDDPFALNPDETYEPEPSSNGRHKPSQPHQHDNARAALDALARALTVTSQLDEPRVEAIARKVATSTYQAGLGSLNQQLGAKVQQLATETLNARAAETEKKLREIAAEAQAKANPAETERAAYDGTRRAIEEAQKKGEDTSALSIPPPVPSLDPLYQDDNPTSASIRYCLATGRCFLVSGPSGSGKTYPVRMECSKASRPIVELSAGDGIGYTHLVGSVTLERDAKGGIVTGWRDGALLRAMRAGAVFLLDEADQLPRPLLALLYGVLEPGRLAELYVPEIGATVRAKDGFTVACTGNTVRDTTGGYSGERPSMALLNRLACIPGDYLSSKAECLIFERCGLDQKHARAMRASLESLRTSYTQGSLTVAPSTRTGVQVARAVLGLLPDGSKPKGGALPVMPERAWTLYLYGALPDAEAAKARMSIEASYRSAGVNWS